MERHGNHLKAVNVQLDSSSVDQNAKKLTKIDVSMCLIPSGMAFNVCVMKGLMLSECNVFVMESQQETDVIDVPTDQTQNGNLEAVGVNLASPCTEPSALEIKKEATHLPLAMLVPSMIPNKADVSLVQLVVSAAPAVMFAQYVDPNLTMMQVLNSVLNSVETVRDLFLSVMMETMLMVMDAALTV